MNNNNKLIRKSAKVTWFVSIAFVFIAIVFLNCFYLPRHLETKVPVSLRTEIPLDPILSGTFITQSFYPTSEYLSGLSICFATYKRSNNCHINIIIKDSTTDKIVYSGQINAKDLVDNSFYDIKLPSTIKNSYGREYIIEISSDSSDLDNAITVWTGVGANERQADTLNKPSRTFMINGDVKDRVIAFYLSYQYPNLARYTWILVTLILLFFLLVIFYKKLYISSTQIINIIYVVFFLFVVAKMLYYVKFVGRFPDENAHISYIAYLENSQKLIPNFYSMKLLQRTNINGQVGFSAVFSNETNYLGHPPLYYHLLRLTGGITQLDNSIYVSLKRLRVGNSIISLSAIVTIFYIGRSRLKKVPIIHLLFAAASTSIPMLTYLCVAINNDNLALLGGTIYILGALRYSEKRRNILTYLLISLGFFIVAMSKLTAGMIIIVSSILYITITFIKEKNAKTLICKNFACITPFIILIIMYYGIVYMQTGFIQPTLDKLNPQDFILSEFYVKPEHRIEMNWYQYLLKFFRSYTETWTSIISHVSLNKPFTFLSLPQFGTFTLLFIPCIHLHPQIHKKNSNSTLILCVYGGIIVTVFTQYMNAYMNAYMKSNRFGGFQSRYILCVSIIFALAIALIAQTLYDKSHNEHKIRSIESSNGLITLSKNRLIETLCILFAAILLYGDFVYFVWNFQQYM